ncbi:unnamed protein product [Didymodactylos carnosus]|uniref:Mitochondrial splicing suppressor 51-like C-terminal domain-containing protein n=1 Tax=Didymodactylos carnosus TaxID=1234261 RepID=A0A814ICL7_9BILA|nr:unnamed protein product [Didymodactylos carnosus]CAF1021739.1 unnamed protein product [Didymodactylos carnosus]CAF3702607.1 unnamed protein product [Didymodactylos carnosus]CAF3793158.1 unnamed protein product [Didymodactylos carnosus]
MIYYCSPQHQRQDWVEHMQKCAELEWCALGKVFINVVLNKRELIQSLPALPPLPKGGEFWSRPCSEITAWTEWFSIRSDIVYLAKNTARVLDNINHISQKRQPTEEDAIDGLLAAVTDIITYPITIGKTFQQFNINAVSKALVIHIIHSHGLDQLNYDKIEKQFQELINMFPNNKGIEIILIAPDIADDTGNQRRPRIKKHSKYNVLLKAEHLIVSVWKGLYIDYVNHENTNYYQPDLIVSFHPNLFTQTTSQKFVMQWSEILRHVLSNNYPLLFTFYDEDEYNKAKSILTASKVNILKSGTNPFSSLIIRQTRGKPNCTFASNSYQMLTKGFIKNQSKTYNGGESLVDKSYHNNGGHNTPSSEDDRSQDIGIQHGSTQPLNHSLKQVNGKIHIETKQQQSRFNGQPALPQRSSIMKFSNGNEIASNGYIMSPSKFVQQSNNDNYQTTDDDNNENNSNNEICLKKKEKETIGQSTVKRDCDNNNQDDLYDFNSEQYKMNDKQSTASSHATVLSQNSRLVHDERIKISPVRLKNNIDMKNEMKPLALPRLETCRSMINVNSHQEQLQQFTYRPNNFIFDSFDVVRQEHQRHSPPVRDQQQPQQTSTSSISPTLSSTSSSCSKQKKSLIHHRTKRKENNNNTCLNINSSKTTSVYHNLSLTNNLHQEREQQLNDVHNNVLQHQHQPDKTNVMRDGNGESSLSSQVSIPSNCHSIQNSIPQIIVPPKPKPRISLTKSATSQQEHPRPIVHCNDTIAACNTAQKPHHVIHNVPVDIVQRVRPLFETETRQNTNSHAFVNGCASKSKDVTNIYQNTVTSSLSYHQHTHGQKNGNSIDEVTRATSPRNKPCPVEHLNSAKLTKPLIQEDNRVCTDLQSPNAISLTNDRSQAKTQNEKTVIYAELSKNDRVLALSIDDLSNDSKCSRIQPPSKLIKQSSLPNGSPTNNDILTPVKSPDQPLITTSLPLSNGIHSTQNELKNDQLSFDQTLVKNKVSDPRPVTKSPLAMTKNALILHHQNHHKESSYLFNVQRYIRENTTGGKILTTDDSFTKKSHTITPDRISIQSRTTIASTIENGIPMKNLSECIDRVGIVFEETSESKANTDKAGSNGFLTTVDLIREQLKQSGQSQQKNGSLLDKLERTNSQSKLANSSSFSTSFNSRPSSQINLRSRSSRTPLGASTLAPPSPVEQQRRSLGIFLPGLATPTLQDQLIYQNIPNLRSCSVNTSRSPSLRLTHKSESSVLTIKNITCVPTAQENAYTDIPAPKQEGEQLLSKKEFTSYPIGTICNGIPKPFRKMYQDKPTAIIEPTTHTNNSKLPKRDSIEIPITTVNTDSEHNYVNFSGDSPPKSILKTSSTTKITVQQLNEHIYNNEINDDIVIQPMAPVVIDNSGGSTSSYTYSTSKTSSIYSTDSDKKTNQTNLPFTKSLLTSTKLSSSCAESLYAISDLPEWGQSNNDKTVVIQDSNATTAVEYDSFDDELEEKNADGQPDFAQIEKSPHSNDNTDDDSFDDELDDKSTKSAQLLTVQIECEQRPTMRPSDKKKKQNSSFLRATLNRLSLTRSNKSLERLNSTPTTLISKDENDVNQTIDSVQTKRQRCESVPNTVGSEINTIVDVLSVDKSSYIENANQQSNKILDSSKKKSLRSIKAKQAAKKTGGAMYMNDQSFDTEDTESIDSNCSTQTTGGGTGTKSKTSRFRLFQRRTEKEFASDTEVEKQQTQQRRKKWVKDSTGSSTLTKSSMKAKRLFSDEDEDNFNDGDNEDDGNDKTHIYEIPDRMQNLSIDTTMSSSTRFGKLTYESKNKSKPTTTLDEIRSEIEAEIAARQQQTQKSNVSLPTSNKQKQEQSRSNSEHNTQRNVESTSLTPRETTSFSTNSPFSSGNKKRSKSVTFLDELVIGDTVEKDSLSTENKHAKRVEKGDARYICGALTGTGPIRGIMKASNDTPPTSPLQAISTAALYLTDDLKPSISPKTATNETSSKNHSRPLSAYASTRLTTQFYDSSVTVTPSDRSIRNTPTSNIYQNESFFKRPTAKVMPMSKHTDTSTNGFVVKEPIVPNRKSTPSTTALTRPIPYNKPNENMGRPSVKKNIQLLHNINVTAALNETVGAVSKTVTSITKLKDSNCPQSDL